MSDKTGKAERPEPSFLRSVNLAEVGLSRGEANRAARRRGEPRKKKTQATGRKEEKRGRTMFARTCQKVPFILPSREESGAERNEGEKRKIGANHCQKSWHFQPQVYFLGVFLGKRLFLGFACL